jgi:hypothetical protein
MILLCGIPTESPLLLVRDRLDAMRMPYLMLSQRRFTEVPFRFRIDDGRVTGEIVIDGRAYALEDILGVYTPAVEHAGALKLAAHELLLDPGELRVVDLVEVPRLSDERRQVGAVVVTVGPELAGNHRRGVLGVHDRLEERDDR